MTWKPMNGDSEYKKRLERIRDKLAEFRDAYVEAELKKMEHLKNTMDRVNEHKAKAATNGMDT